MFKFTKWLVLLMLSGFIFSQNISANETSQYSEMVNYLKSQNVKIILNGQSFSVFIPVDQVFVSNSTNMIASTRLLRKLRAFVEQYDPDSVSILGRFDFDVTPRERDLVREQAILLMKGLDLKAPGRIVATGTEGIYKNNNLKFWEEVKTTKLIEVRWRSRLDVQYMVLDGIENTK